MNLKHLKEMLWWQGASDYEMRKAKIFRDKYIKVMSKYENFDNYNLLEEKLESIKNPIKFYDFVSKNELIKDLTYQSDERYTQLQFNAFLEEMGIEVKQDESVGKVGKIEMEWRYKHKKRGEI